MSLIEDAGKGLQDSVFGLHSAKESVHASRAQLADAQGILTGVAKESNDPQLNQAIKEYARAIDELTAAMGCIATAGEGIGIMATRIDCEVMALDIPDRPEVYVTDVPAPVPREGDPGNTTPEQFVAYKRLEKQIDLQIGEEGDPEDLDGYIESNNLCHLFQTSDGKTMKVPVERRGIYTEEHDSLMPAGIMWHIHARALRQGIGQDGLEQFVAYIDDEGGWKRGAVVCETVLGVPPIDLTDAEIAAIPEEHLEQLMQTFQAMETHGLIHDNGLINVKYDREKGFTLTDYWIFEEWQRFTSFSGDACESGKAEDMAADFIWMHSDRGGYPIERYLATFERTFGTPATEELRERIRQDSV